MGKLEILEDGQFQVREDTVIERDGVEVARLFHRRVLAPTEQSNVPLDEHPQIRAVSAIVWTPEVIAEYRRRRAAQVPIGGTGDTREDPR